MRLALGTGPRESVHKEVELPLPTDERRLDHLIEDIHAEPCPSLDRGEDRHRRALSLCRDRLGVLEDDRPLGGAICRLVDEDAVDRGRCLQPRSGVDDIA